MGGYGGALSSTADQQDTVASSSHGPEQHEPRSNATELKARKCSMRGRSGSGRDNRPTSFLVRHETEILHPSPSSVEDIQIEDSTYGVKSLDSTIGEEGPPDTLPNAALEPSPRRKPSTSPILQQAQRGMDRTPHALSDPSQPPSPQSLRSSPLLPLSRESSAGHLSASLTPFHIHSPYTRSDHNTSSTPRSASPRSLRSSDEEAIFDHSSSSGEEDTRDEAARAGLFEDNMPLSTPQLVMPSMSFPERRPFTERGSRIGKLRIAVVGEKGCGKSSLIRAMTQCCEDIVHVEAAKWRRAGCSTHHSRSAEAPDNSFISTTASTRPRPAWMNGVGSGASSSRRKSGSSRENPLGRNIEFVEFPGIENHLTSDDPLIYRYMNEQVDACMSMSRLSLEDKIDLFGGHGGRQFHALIYVLSPSPDNTPTYLSALSAYTNVIPVLVKSDTLSEEETRLAIQRHQAQIATSCPTNTNKPFDLTSPSDPYHAAPTTIFPISTLPSTSDVNEDLMDASLLMNSQYHPPLTPSGLQEMVHRLFDPEMTATLRHLSAVKLLEQLRQHPPRPCQTSSPSPSVHNLPEALEETLEETGVLISHPSLPPTTTSTNTGTGPANDKRAGQTRIARWAADLHRSLQREGERYGYSRLTGAGASGPPTQRQVQDTEKPNSWTAADQIESGLTRSYSMEGKDCKQLEGWTPQDPLRLLEWDARLRRRGLIVARVLGGCGIVGAAVLWALRWWGWSWSWEGGIVGEVSTGASLSNGCGGSFGGSLGQGIGWFGAGGYR